ncbi:iron-containing alcohol dehydrogenase, partial [Acinetobacter baumannii]
MAKPYYEFFCPVKVIAGNAALEHIPFELATLGAKRPLIITDKGVRANGLLNPIEAAFSTTDAEVNKTVFEQCEARNLLVNSVDDI